ncbi:MAG: hypothetical protein K0U74_14680 [Alphaproteobacteria bacterium]|nr:hypothetical protein [Alphaproteobacteria bacterium]
MHLDYHGCLILWNPHPNLLIGTSNPNEANLAIAAAVAAIMSVHLIRGSIRRLNGHPRFTD